MNTKENWQEIGEAMEMLYKAGLLPVVAAAIDHTDGWDAGIFCHKPVTQQGYIKSHAETATEAMKSLLAEPEIIKLLRDAQAHKDLEDATSEELREAAVWFHCKDIADPSEQQLVAQFIRLGWRLAQPEGYVHIHPWWLKESQQTK